MENFIFCAVSQVKLVLYPGFSNTLSETLWTYGSKYSRTDQVKFTEDSLLKFKMIWFAFKKH